MWGAVEPTKPFNYHISGTAMQWTNKAMIRTHAQLREWDQKEGFRGRLALQVHDELVPDFPAPRLGPGTPQQLKDEPWRLHLPRVKRLQRLMEQGGDDIGVPTPVSIEYHVDNWAEGVTI